MAGQLAAIIHRLVVGGYLSLAERAIVTRGYFASWPRILGSRAADIARLTRNSQPLTTPGERLV